MAGLNVRTWRAAGVAAALLHVVTALGFGWALDD